jgi:hypothetical protein
MASWGVYFGGSFPARKFAAQLYPPFSLLKKTFSPHIKIPLFVNAMSRTRSGLVPSLKFSPYPIEYLDTRIKYEI